MGTRKAMVSHGLSKGTACLPDVHLLCALPFGHNGWQGARRRNQFKVKGTKMRQSQMPDYMYLFTSVKVLLTTTGQEI